MKKLIYSLSVAASVICYGQKPQFSVNIKGNVVFPTGNNFMADGLKTFSGFGLGFQGIVFHNFGIGLEFNKFYTDVKDVSVFGALKSPALTDFSISLLYQYPLNENFKIEGQAGIGSLEMKSRSDYRSDGFKETAKSVLLGAKVLYSLNESKSVQVFAGPKVYFYSSDLDFEDEAVKKYYSNATLFNINAGIRFNF